MTIEQRVEKLEQELTETKAQAARAKRRNRCLLAAGGLCLAIGLVAWAFGAGELLAQPAAPTAKEVRAKRFVVEDANGKSRAMLTVNKDDPGLALLDKNGKPRATLIVGKRGAGLVLWNKNGKSGVMLSLSNDQPALMLSDAKGKTRAALNVNKDGAGLLLIDAKGKIIWGAPR